MSDTTTTAPDLLDSALQDIRAGADLLIAHLPAIRDAVSDQRLRDAFERLIADVAERRGRLEDTGRAGGGPPNLWMQGVVDDAERDSDTVAPGPLLDTALIGAIRKGLVADVAAYDTAIALAEATDEAALAVSLSRLRDGASANDATLLALLEKMPAVATS